ncbi:YobI family P-loop NTPase [Proteus mirabilis]|uniref:YobI family P-loop NTPase n=1 Tax=Proteus mirabilis TaxID=584 RepID=UPI0034D4AF82
MGDEKYKFQKLTPTSDIDLGIYEDAINFVFDNDDLKNIAISGQYGAGKSSLIESYKKNYPNKKFVHISLAHFRTAEPAETNEPNSPPISANVLEGKILNQLIHQINADDIPQTNFKVKKKVTSKSIFKNTFWMVFFIALILHVMLFDKWRDFVSLLSDGRLKTLLIFTTKHDSLLISGAICAILSCVFIYVLIRIQKNRNMLRKISLQGNEINIFEESEESYFDRYLNEVLYLFENVNADAIIFEDMDRFNANDIFERLHEVNRLVNIQRRLVKNSWLLSKLLPKFLSGFLFRLLSKHKKPTLRFIYLLRDDIFISKDRIKFFDYIVPVIPVVDSSNSYNQFISIFDEGRVLKLFNERFLQGISLYVDDMRMLKNIYNEFLVYHDRLNTTELDCNKMLAIIAYKNIFPKDFSELQVNQGLVFTIFSEKENIINEEMEKLEKEISDRKKDIEVINNEILRSIQEVDAVYDKELSQYHSNPYYDKDEKADVAQRRESRKVNVENKTNGKIEKINEILSKLREDLVDFRSKKLKEIITRENIDKLFKLTYINEIGEERNFNEIKSSEYFDLLKYLIRDGYIDETYTDYMTYFYENSLSRIDKMFLRSITDQKSKEFTYQLKNPKMVVTRLREVDFEQEETLNFDLLTYLLQTQTPAHLNLIKRLFKQLRGNKSVEFIRDYFELEKAQPSFINRLNTLWPEFFSYALKESEFSADWVKRYSIGTLYYSASNVIETINVDNCLTDYLSDSADYLAIAEPKIDKLISGFKLLNASFVNINFERANKTLFDRVYQQSLYGINFANITLMLSKVYQFNSEDDIRHKNYTLVMSQPEAPLARYVNNHISNYLDMVLSSCEGSITDDETIVLSVLNNEEISDEQKEQYINSLQTFVTSLSAVESESLWSSLLDKDKVVCSEENILSYFVSLDGLDDSLIGFINRTDAELNFASIDIEDEQEGKLFRAIIICNDLLNDKYEKLICSLNRIYESSFGINGIVGDKFKILVDKKIIRMSVDSLEFIRESYPEELFYYIRKNIETYVELMVAENFVLDEAISIISCNVDDDIKIKLLELVKTSLTIHDKEYSPAVNDYILENNFEPDELLDLTSSYKTWATSTQLLILSLAIEHISTLIATSDDIPEPLLIDLFTSETLDIQDKIALLIALLSGKDLSKVVSKEYLDLLGLSEFSKILGRGKPKIEVNATNQSLLTALRDSKLFYDFEMDEENPAYYNIIKKQSILGVNK